MNRNSEEDLLKAVVMGVRYVTKAADGLLAAELTLKVVWASHPTVPVGLSRVCML